ncbi:MAG: hypothetical protein ABIO02_03540 [Patescibacteria group bacterium]
MSNTSNVSPSNPYYHEEMTYDSNKENWAGLGSILLVPLFIMLVGLGIASTFKIPSSNDLNNDNLQIGIGGGPGKASPSPYKVPSITITPGKIAGPTLPVDDGLYSIQ